MSVLHVHFWFLTVFILSQGLCADYYVGLYISPSTVFTRWTTVKLLVTLTNTSAARINGIEVQCVLTEMSAVPNSDKEWSDGHNGTLPGKRNSSESHSDVSTTLHSAVTGNITEGFPWHPQRKILVFTESVTRPLTLTRREHPAKRAVEVLTVDCRVVGGHPEALATTTVTVDVGPSLSIDWDSAHGIGDLWHGAYREIAACPCDVFHTSCDLDCCCDSDCSPRDIESFNCVADAQGTQRSSRDCLLEINSQSHWVPFLCLQVDNSPYLGHYYPDVPVSKTYKPFPQNHHGYLPKLAESGKYVKGQKIKSGDRVTGVTFPAMVLDNRCAHSAPIAFLTDKTSLCALRTSSQDCISGSTLDIGRYIGNFGSGDWAFTSSCRKNGTWLGPCGSMGIKWDEKLGLCRNVVTSVIVVFIWGQGLIDKVILTVKLKDLTGDVQLHGEFTVKFEHSRSDVEMENWNRNNWYMLGGPLILGTLDRNESNAGPTNPKLLRMLSQGPAGRCSKSLGHPGEFGFDAFSGCFLQLEEEDIRSCDVLRRKTIAHACSLLPASTSSSSSIMMTKMMMMMTSQGGNLNGTAQSDLIPFLRQDDECSNLTIEEHSAAGEKDPGPKPNFCSNLMTHLRVTVIYKTLEGFSSTFTVLAANIRTSSSYWRRNSGSMDGIQEIPLTTTLMFVQVGENGSSKRFWSELSKVPCLQDRCWSYALGPVTDTTLHTLIFSAILIFVSAFYLAQGHQW